MSEASSAKITEPVSDLQLRIEQGFDGYLSLKERLSYHVSAAEAEEARALTARSITALLISVCLVAFARYIGENLPPGTARWKVDFLLYLLPLALILVCHGAHSIPYAGRVLAVASVTTTQWSFFPVNSGALDPVAGDFGRVAWVCIAYVLGSMLDFSLSAQPGRSKALARRVLLVALAVGWIAARINMFPLQDSLWRMPWFPVNAIVSLLLLTWLWPLGPWIERRRKLKSNDARLVFEIGLIRRFRHIAGRVMAVCSIALTALVLINSGSTADGMAYNDVGDPIVTYAVEGADGKRMEDLSYFFHRTGLPLRASDLTNEKRRVFVVPKSASDLHTTLQSGMQSGVYGSSYAFATKASVARLEKDLEPYRASTPEQLAKMVEEGRDWRAYAIEDLPKSQPRSDGKNSLIVPLPLAEKGMTREIFAHLSSFHSLYLFTSASLAALSFLVLWRRGGDLVTARLLGVWLAGASFLCTFAYLEQTLDGVSLRLALVGNTLQSSAYSILYVFATMLLVLYLTNWLPWSIYARVRPVASGGNYGQNWLWGVRAAFLATILIPLMVLLPFFGAYLPTFQISLFVSWFLSLAGLATFEFWIRYREKKEKRLRISRLQSALIVGGIIAVHLLAIIGPFSARMPEPGSRIFSVLTCGVFAIGAVVAFRKLLQSSFLGGGDNRDASFLVLGILLPTGFELSNDQLEAYLNSQAIFTTSGAKIAGAVLVILLIQPAQHVVMTLINNFTNPGMGRVRATAASVLEKCACNPTGVGLGEQVAPLLKELGVSKYAYYRRSGENRFHCFVSTLPLGPEVLELSPSLRKRLGQRHLLIDLTTVHLSWSYFFEQFELHRIHRSLQAKYLMPVRLGSTPCGILFIEATNEITALSHQDVLDSVNNVSLASWRSGSTT